MKMEVKFNMIYNIDTIVKTTGRSKEEVKKSVAENIYEEVKEFLKYEFEDKGVITIENLDVKY